MGRNWTTDEDQFLRKHYNTVSAAECARQLNTGRTRGMVIGRASRLGLSSNIIGGGWAGGKLRQRGDPKTKVRKPYVSNGRPPLKPTFEDRVKSVEVVKAYEEPIMPVLEGNARLHSRQYGDLEDGMCRWPVYVEQGVQMYCAGKTARLPGRWDTYCACHYEMSLREPEQRRARRAR